MTIPLPPWTQSIHPEPDDSWDENGEAAPVEDSEDAKCLDDEDVQKVLSVNRARLEGLPTWQQQVARARSDPNSILFGL